jgi:hypothetical protein
MPIQHMKEVLAKQEDLVNELEQMKEHHKKVRIF